MMLNNLVIEGVVVSPPERVENGEVIFTIENDSPAGRFDVLIVTEELLAERTLERVQNDSLVRIVGALDSTFAVIANHIEVPKPNGRYAPLISP